MQEGDIILIKWIDAEDNPHWMGTEEAKQRPNVDCNSVGMFLKEDDELLWYSTSVSGNERDRHVIPKGCIKSVKVIYSMQSNEERKGITRTTEITEAAGYFRGSESET